MIFDLSACNRYLKHRYLVNAHEGQISHRHDAVCANLWTALPPGDARLHDDPNKASFWAEKLTEVRTERFIRSQKAGIYRGSPQDFVGFDEVRFLSTATLEPRITNAIRSFKSPPSPFLVRFSDAQYVQDALKHGRFRISPAAEYNDPSLNAAQQDDELVHAAVRGDRHIVMQFNGYLTGEDPSQAGPMPVEWKEMFHYMNSANFYVLCLTDQFDGRMFRDFGKDAAILIRDPAAFTGRLRNVTRSNFPQLHFKADTVKYYDPYTVEQHELLPGVSKNFSFSYQSEFRLSWWQRDTRARLSPFFIEIGDLQDIAEAVFL